MRFLGSEVAMLSLCVASAALSALAVLSCGGEDPPAFLPELPPGCSRDQRLQRLTELGDLEERFALLARQPRSPATSDAASDELLTSLRDLLAKPCLAHAAALLPLPEYARWESISFAARNGLFPALRDLTAIHRIASRRALALPPELLPEVDPAARLELRALACPDDGVTPCVDSAAALAPLTAEFVRQELPAADEGDIPLLEPQGAAHRRGAFDERRGPLRSPCRARWRGVWQTGALSAWFSCVRQRAPRQLRYHAPAQLRALDRGWLALREYYGHHADDYFLWTFDLASGAAYVAIARNFNSDGAAAIKLRSGRVPVAEVRRLALALVARPALVAVRAAPAFVELPPPREVTFTPYEMTAILEEEKEASSMEGLPAGDAHRAGGSAQGETHFVLADGGPEGAAVRFAGVFRSQSTYGTNRLAAEQLAALTRALDETCTPAPYPALPAFPSAPPPPMDREHACFACRLDENFRTIERAFAERTPRPCS